MTFVPFSSELAVAASATRLVSRVSQKCHFGVLVTLTGTVTDFDREGLFGLIRTDDGCLLPFNLRETPPALRRRFEVGTRVKFTRHTSEPTTRAIEVVPIDTPSGNTPPSATAREL
jgi:hypothetical protein